MCKSIADLYHQQCTSRSENLINKEVDMLLGPQDFMLLIIEVSSITVHGVRKRLLLFDSLRYEVKHALDFGILASTDDPMLTKKLFKESAISVFDTFSSAL